MKTKVILSKEEFGIVLVQCGRWFTLYYEDKIIAKAGDNSTAIKYYNDLVRIHKKTHGIN